MYFTCVFRNRPKSARASRYAENKLKGTVQQFTPKPFRMHMTLEPEGNSQVVHLSLLSGKNFSVSLSASGNGTYEAIDNITMKLREFLRRRKERAQKQQSHLDKFMLAQIDTEGTFKQWRLDDYDSVDAGDILTYEAARRRNGGYLRLVQ